jgi:hypothetical protein
MVQNCKFIKVGGLKMHFNSIPLIKKKTQFLKIKLKYFDFQVSRLFDFGPTSFYCSILSFQVSQLFGFDS